MPQYSLGGQNFAYPQMSSLATKTLVQKRLTMVEQEVSYALPDSIQVRSAHAASKTATGIKKDQYPLRQLNT